MAILKPVVATPFRPRELQTSLHRLFGDQYLCNGSHLRAESWFSRYFWSRLSESAVRIGLSLFVFDLLSSEMCNIFGAGKKYLFSRTPCEDKSVHQ